ncbi:unnamed protein product [Pieris macdunnoughi]|uniref:Uncharacterized protein n=1 Tax=Pieris macdunnoughi TaxID=345717 RepID=A0A821KUN6_9NEOP|nr:unnamed protein product [Pieris macdunnoughi]
MEFEGNIMHGREYWESSVRLSVGEDFGMFLEEGRKRKWEGKEEKEQRKVPPKKVMATRIKENTNTKHISILIDLKKLELNNVNNDHPTLN